MRDEICFFPMQLSFEALFARDLSREYILIQLTL